MAGQLRNPVEIFEVDSPYAGRLSVCYRPRGGSFLQNDVHTLRAAGWDVLVSALQPAEVVELQLGAVAEHCAEHGVEYYPFPIGNLQVPPLDQSMGHFAALRMRLDSGKSVTAHCYGSIGRSPLIVATLLVLGGVAPGDAWGRIREARREQVPDTYEQRDWVVQFAGLKLPDLGATE